MEFWEGPPPSLDPLEEDIMIGKDKEKVSRIPASNPTTMESEKRDRNVVCPLFGVPQRFLWVSMVHRSGYDLCAVGETSGTP